MRNLRLSEWANIPEIVASIVIVASLAYIGRELNQNTQALQHGSYQTTVATLIELDVAEATSEDLSCNLGFKRFWAEKALGFHLNLSSILRW